MENIELWSLVVGFLLPPVLSIIMQSHWSDQVQAVVAFVACLLAGAGTAYFQGDLTAKRWVEASLVVLVTTIATYKGFWKPTRVSPTIEAATTANPG